MALPCFHSCCRNIYGPPFLCGFHTQHSVCVYVCIDWHCLFPSATSQSSLRFTLRFELGFVCSTRKNRFPQETSSVIYGIIAKARLQEPWEKTLSSHTLPLSFLAQLNRWRKMWDWAREPRCMTEYYGPKELAGPSPSGLALGTVLPNENHFCRGAIPLAHYSSKWEAVVGHPEAAPPLTGGGNFRKAGPWVRRRATHQQCFTHHTPSDTSAWKSLYWRVNYRMRCEWQLWALCLPPKCRALQVWVPT